MAATDERRYRLFAYGTLLPGEPDHELLQGAEPLGEARTKPCYQLVEHGPSAGLLEGGTVAVAGELYQLDVKTLAACDIKREHPVLYLRLPVRLADGSEAFAYFLRPEQTRGCRRIRDGDWKSRFKAKPSATRARGWHR